MLQLGFGHAGSGVRPWSTPVPTASLHLRLEDPLQMSKKSKPKSLLVGILPSDMLLCISRSGLEHEGETNATYLDPDLDNLI